MINDRRRGYYRLSIAFEVVYGGGYGRWNKERNGVPAITATNTAEGVTTPNLLQHPAEVVRPNNIQSETMVTIMVLRDTNNNLRSEALKVFSKFLE